MAEFAALPLFTDAWIADTKHLTRLERGTYHDLLVLIWRTPECRVPNDDNWLAKRLGMAVSDIANELRPLIKEFCRTDGNWLFQKRLRKEWEWCQRNRKNQSERAKSRWNKEKNNTQADAKAMPARIAPHPTLPLKKERIDSFTLANGLKIPMQVNGHISTKQTEFERFWEAYPRKEGKKVAEAAFAKAIKETTLDQMLATLAWQTKQWTDPKYIPHPATWLNKGRWADEKPIRGKFSEFSGIT